MFSSTAADNRDLAEEIFHELRAFPLQFRNKEELNTATTKAACGVCTRICAVYLHLRSNFHDFISG